MMFTLQVAEENLIWTPRRMRQGDASKTRRGDEREALGKRAFGNQAPNSNSVFRQTQDHQAEPGEKAGSCQISGNTNPCMQVSVVVHLCSFS